MTQTSSTRAAGVIAATSFGFALVQLDVTVVNVALPRLGHDLHCGVSALQWIVDAYAVALAAVLLSGGVLSDRIGARRAYLIGLGVFAAASAGCALAPGAGALIGARAIQGLGAAVMLPSSLAFLDQGLPDRAMRARAVGLWTAAGGCAITAGPILGGLVLQALSWRALFLLNLPVCALAAVLAMRQGSQAPAGERRPGDVAGQVLAIVTLAALTSAVIEARPLGFSSPAVLAGALAALMAGAGFLRQEARSARPMLPLRLFRRRGFGLAIGFGVIVNLTLYGVLFVLSLYFQGALHYSPLRTGIAYLPLMGLVTAANVASGPLVSRAGVRMPMAIGALAGAAGFLGLGLFAAGGPYWRMIPAFVLISLGIGSAVPAMTTSVLGSVEPGASGLASGVLNAARQAGGAVGVALFGALGGQGGAAAESGLRTSSVIAAALLCVAGALALRLGRSTEGRPGGQSAPEPPAPARVPEATSGARYVEDAPDPPGTAELLQGAAARPAAQRRAGPPR